jgi:hypothetical protein
MRYLTAILLFVSLSLNGQIRNDLRAHWSFEESSSAFVDSIGSHNATINGTVTNGSTNPILGDYGDFPGSAGNYAASDTISLNNKTATISAFSYITTAQGNRAIIGRWYGQQRISTNSSGTQWEIQINNNTWTSSNLPVVTDTWQHILVTYDGNLVSNNVKVYLNGNLVFTANCTEDVNNNDKNWQIGSNGNDSYNFIGKIDEVSIWDRALDSDEADSIYNFASPSYPYQWSPTSTPASPPYTGLLTFLSSDTVYMWSSVLNDTVYMYRGGYTEPTIPPTFTGGGLLFF